MYEDNFSAIHIMYLHCSSKSFKHYETDWKSKINLFFFIYHAPLNFNVGFKRDWNTCSLNFLYLDFRSNSFLNNMSAYWTFSQRHCACRTWCNMTARSKDYSNPYFHTYFTHKSIVFWFQISRQVIFETRTIRIRISVYRFSFHIFRWCTCRCVCGFDNAIQYILKS